MVYTVSYIKLVSTLLLSLGSRVLFFRNKLQGGGGKKFLLFEVLCLGMHLVGQSCGWKNVVGQTWTGSQPHIFTATPGCALCTSPLRALWVEVGKDYSRLLSQHYGSLGLQKVGNHLHPTRSRGWTNHCNYSLLFLTWSLDFAAAQCYYHQFGITQGPG